MRGNWCAKAFKNAIKPLVALCLKIDDLVSSYVMYLFSPKDNVDEIADKVLVKSIKQDVLAIVAIRQTDEVNPNFKKMLDELVAKGIGLIIFNNSKLREDEADKLRSLAVIYHERVSGLGRDFACYKLGVSVINVLIKKLNPNIKRFCFINDSVFILTSRFSQFLDRFLSTQADWVGVTESLSGCYHVSSWFFSVSNKLWCEPKFQKFWKSYVPLASRSYNIHNGEMALSTLIIRLGYAPAVLYSAAFFLKSIFFSFSSTQCIENLKWIGHYKDFWKAFNLSEDRSLINIDTLSSWAKLYIQNQQDFHNQTAFWQLLSVLYSDFPFIKRDIYYRRVFSLTQLRMLGLEKAMESDPDWSYIFSRIISVPDQRTLRLYKRARYIFGYE